MFPFLGLILFLAGFPLVASALKAYRRSRYVKDTPSSTPGSIALGRAEVQGTARPINETLPHPIGGDPVLLFHYLRLYGTREEENSTIWKVRDEASLGSPFFLEDDDGRVVVDPKEATLLPELVDDKRKHLLEFEMWDQEENPPNHLQSFLDNRKSIRADHECQSSQDRIAPSGTSRYPGLLPPPSLGAGCLVVSHAIHPGDTTYVLGDAQKPSSDLASHQGASAVFRSPDQGFSFGDSPFLISCQSEDDLRETLDTNFTRQLGLGTILILLGPALMLGSCSL